MCLYRADLILEENKNGDMVGVGYKQMFKDNISVTKRWLKAKHINMLNVDKKYKTIKPNKGRSYSFGFHIFLTIEDAKNYSNDKYGNKAIYRVEFKNVVAFGPNRTYLDNKMKPCVIARDMRYMEIIEV